MSTESSSSSASSSTIVPHLGDGSIKVSGKETLLVRFPTKHHFGIFSDAWLDVVSELHKQFVNAGCYVVPEDTDPTAQDLTLCRTYTRVNLGEVKEYKVMDSDKADEFLKEEAVAYFDRAAAAKKNKP